MPTHLNLIDKAFLLKKTPFFGDLDLDLLLSIADKLQPIHIRSNENIFSLGQDAFQMYLIVTGIVLIQNESKQTLAELGAGDFFGDEALFNQKKRAYSASARTKTDLLFLSRTHLLSIIYECPSVAIALLEAYTAHLPFRSR